MCTWNSSTEELEAQAQEFKAILTAELGTNVGYMRACLKTKNKNKKSKAHELLWVDSLHSQNTKAVSSVLSMVGVLLSNKNKQKTP